MHIRRIFVGALAAWSLLTLPVQADTVFNDVIIVIDGRVPGQQSLAKGLRQALKQAREKTGSNVSALPIDTYDLSQPGQRIAARRLHIDASQCPFLGIGRLPGPASVPSQVLVSVPNVASVDDGLSRLGEELNPDKGKAESPR